MSVRKRKEEPTAAQGRRFRVVPLWTVLRGNRWRWLAFLALTALVGMGVVAGGLYLHFAPSLPHFASIDDYQPKLGTRIYSADDQLIGVFAAERRVLVPHEKIPPLLFKAFISAEDQRFYEHHGIDFLGVAKAVSDKIRNPKSKLRGASTITQQVAKSLLASHDTYQSATERTLSRKLREAILARRLEQRLTKDQILYIYVSQIFLGHKAYGVQSAAEHYFRKNVWDLTLAEMATLAGLPQRPSDYSPYVRPKAAKARRQYVLRRMHEEGFIDAEEREAAEEEDIKVYDRDDRYLAVSPYYTEQVRRAVVERYGERALLEDGLQVYTGLNIEAQAMARNAVADGLYALDKRQGFRGALTRLTEPSVRDLFVKKYREKLGLDYEAALIPEAGTTYLGLVTNIDGEGLTATLDVAGLVGALPLAGMRWARRPNPTERVEWHYLRNLREVLREGDVVMVKPTTMESLAQNVHSGDTWRDAPEDMPLFELDQEPIAQAALLSVDPHTGYVVAQVGGYDFDVSKYNRAVQACREPGSAFKPIVYSAAIDKLDYTASTMVYDKPLVFDDPENEMRWKPNNAGQRFRGQLPLRTCLKDSINTPAIRIADAVGIDDVIANAHNLGIDSPLKRELGTALGSSCTTLLELVRVYTTLNQYGARRPVRFIRRVVDRYGNVLEDHTAPWDPMIDFDSRLDRAYLRLIDPPEQVLDPQTAFLMTRLLRNVVMSGTGMGARAAGQVAAGKTGTTNDAYDAWFMGYTSSLVTGAWVGHDKKERPLGINEQGAKTALPLWVAFNRDYLRDYTKPNHPPILHTDFEPPPGVIEVKIDPDTGLLARPNATRVVSEYYRSGSEPTEYAPDEKVLDPDQLDPFMADTPL